jgi:hypothetical protein
VSEYAYVQMLNRSKKPLAKEWNKRESAIYDKSQLAGGNVGIALAFCNPVLCSLDIDHLPSAKPTLNEINIDPQTIDATRIKSGRENSLKLLFKLEKPLKTVVIKADGRVSFELRCANSTGTTVCEVIPPSIHPSGSNYVWDGLRDLDDVTEIPESLLDYWHALLEAEKRKKQAPVRELFPVYQDESPRQVTLLRDQLAHVSPDCTYEQWRDVVFAILSTRWSCAYDIALNWSQRSDKFDYRTFQSLVDSFHPHATGSIGKAITRGTLIYYARQGGYQW